MSAWWSARSRRTQIILVIIGLLLLIGVVGPKSPSTTNPSATPTAVAVGTSGTPAATTATSAAPTPPPWQRLANVVSGGNNAEAASWAKALCCFGSGFDYKLWMDLTPSVGGDVTGTALTQYRTSVTQAVGYIVLPPAALAEWNRDSADVKTSFLQSLLDSTHKAPAIVTGPLDYYPNATLVRYTMYKEDGTILATAEWSSAGGVNTIKLSQ